MKRILFITSANLSCNPRLLKEVRLALQQGYQPTVIAFNLHNWSAAKEEDLKKELQQVAFHYLETTSASFFPWLASSLIEKISRFIRPLFPTSLYVSAMAVSKRNWLLLKWLKKDLGKFDLVIAHNPATFYPAYYYSKKNKTPFALDIEDYHPGESNSKTETDSVKLLMQKIIPFTAYTSYASPLIKKYTEKLLPQKQAKDSFVINNLFSSMDFILPAPKKDNESKLKIVWFSQVVDRNRGLENILPVLDLFEDKISLTLIGNMKEEFFNAEVKERKYIFCLPPLPQKKLNGQLSAYDIGLAIEPGRDLNNKIALSNKIWSYYQAGLYIIASNTEAQQLFINQDPERGICTSLEPATFKENFSAVIKNKELIRRQQEKRASVAVGNSWEIESTVLLNEWQKILQEH